MNLRCDSHVHIVGPPDRYPQVANRTYLAALAPLPELERAAASRDVRRFVIVQPSFYGTDNTLLLAGLDALGGRGRGVAVIDAESESAESLADFAARGVRGLRINLYSPLGGKAPLAQRFKALEALAQRLAWHIEVIAPLDMLAANADLLAGSSVPVVVDHYGLYAGHAPDGPTGRGFLGLLGRAHVWIKLSAPYRVSEDALATRADPAWFAAILAAAPERCVWGSDWPHTPPHAAQGDGAVALPYRPIRYDFLVDEFAAAVGSAEMFERIMSDNPARLYGFNG